MKMYLKIISALIFLLAPMHANGQTVTWTRYYDPSGFMDRGVDVIENPDTTYIFLSNTNLGVCLTKTDKYGNLIWEKLYDSLGSGSRSLYKTSDNGFVIAGQSSSPINSMQLTKVDNSGNIVWLKKYIRPGKQSRAFSVKETIDKGFIMCGEIYPAAPNEVYVVKTDSLGNLQWERQYNGVTTYDIIQSDDGNYYTVGYFVLRKLNRFGEEKWAHSIGSAIKILQSKDGYLYTGGGLNQFNLNKIDTSGKFIFQKDYFSQAYCRGMCINPKGEIILTGSISTDTGTVKQNLDVLIAVFDTSGNVRHSNVISLGKTPQGLVTQEATQSIKSTLDQGYVLCGTTNYPTGNELFDNILVIKTDSLGTTSPVTAILNNFSKIEDFQLYQNYPNPFNPVTKINFTIPVDEKVTLKIYDILGKEVKTLVNEFRNSGSYQVIFNGINLSSGVYYYKIESGSFTQVRKMVLIK